MLRLSNTILSLLIPLALLSRVGGQETAPSSLDIERLEFIESFHHDDLGSVNRLIISEDNKFLYAASWVPGTITVFTRDQSSGKIKHLQTLKMPEIEGAIKLALNADQSRIGVICLRSTRVLLLARDGETGMVKKSGLIESGATWPVSICFSPDSKFLYIADAGGSSTARNAPSGVLGFQISESGEMTKIGKFVEPELKGARDVVLSPDGKLLVAACSQGNSVVTFDRDTENGALKKRQVFVDGQESPTLLAGAHAAMFNRAGTRLYVVSGRFEGDNGFTIFNVSKNGAVEFDCELEIAAPPYRGGNHLAISSDEQFFFLSSTQGNCIATAFLDTDTSKPVLLGIVNTDAGCDLNGASGLVLDRQENFLYAAAEKGSAITCIRLVR